MTEERRPFQKYASLFRTLVFDTLASSAEYQGAVEAFDSVALLGDRILAAFCQDPEFGRVSSISERLEKLSVLSQGHQNTSEQEEQLLQETELWLKAIVRLALPERHKQLRDADDASENRRFNLFASLRELDLLTTQQLNLHRKDWRTITDPVRQAIFLAKEDRNPVTHETATLGYATRTLMLPGALLTLIAPLFKHTEALRQCLRHLVTNLPSTEVEGVAQSVRSERNGHLSRFAGRLTWLKQLRLKLEQTPSVAGGYLLLTAEEGTGKSAVCAKLSEELRCEGDTLGANAVRIGRQMPWLPGPVLHFGKSSKDADEIVRFLLSQVNAMLIEPVEAPAAMLAADPATFLPTILDRTGGDEYEASFGLEDDAIRRAWRAADQIRSHLRFGSGAATTVSPADQWRRAVYQALERLVQERGSVVLLIDAIDEIAHDGSGLAFLPPRLPPGACGLLSGRPETLAYKWTRDNLNVIQQISLKGLERSEIPLLTGVADDAPEHVTFNDRVSRETQ